MAAIKDSGWTKTTTDGAFSKNTTYRVARVRVHTRTHAKVLSFKNGFKVALLMHWYTMPC